MSNIYVIEIKLSKYSSMVIDNRFQTTIVLGVWKVKYNEVHLL